MLGPTAAVLEFCWAAVVPLSLEELELSVSAVLLEEIETDVLLLELMLFEAACGADTVLSSAARSVVLATPTLVCMGFAVLPSVLFFEVALFAPKMRAAASRLPTNTKLVNRFLTSIMKARLCGFYEQ